MRKGKSKKNWRNFSILDTTTKLSKFDNKDLKETAQWRIKHSQKSLVRPKFIKWWGRGFKTHQVHV